MLTMKAFGLTIIVLPIRLEAVDAHSLGMPLSLTIPCDNGLAIPDQNIFYFIFQNLYVIVSEPYIGFITFRYVTTSRLPYALIFKPRSIHVSFI
jgi:hypothetical protein